MLFDDKGYANTLVDSIVDSNLAYVALYLASNVAAGTRFMKLHRATNNSFNVAMSASEYYNVGARDVHHCNASSSSATVAGLAWEHTHSTGEAGAVMVFK